MDAYTPHLEALLFFKGESVPITELAELLELDTESVHTALTELQDKLARDGRGVRIVLTDTHAALSTAPETNEYVERAHKAEYAKELSKAALETLAVIIYHGPVSKATLDYIRGVNTGTILRNLQTRGLIEKTTDTAQRTTYYQPTAELFQHLGITRADELPEYHEVRQELETNTAYARDTESQQHN